jgi:catechol 2,3-dioxygenase-like lactoylglutathione lyase family enzyme
VHRLIDARGIVLELLQFQRPGTVGTPTRRSMNALGHTHINYYVRDFEQTLADVVRHGGAVHAVTRLESQMADGTRCPMVYCTDPDGTRIEVWTTDPYGAGGSVVEPIAGIDRKFSHSGVCVTDVARSAAFYGHLGVHLAETFDYRAYPGALDTVLELSGSELLAQMLRGTAPDVVELLYFAKPVASGSGRPAPVNSLGYGAIAFEVDDLAGTAVALLQAGGVALTQPVRDGNELRQSFADPDGARITLLQRSGTVAR